MSAREDGTRRTRAMVAACEGISTEALEKVSVRELVHLVIQYRDDLRRPPSSDSVERRLAAINAVLSKWNGGQQ